ncbi:MAG: M18 family aminopeptidase [Lachnospiraceae bacterium]|nr:M18 family aminopeptidase [Lachnospiraceae bacterium]
MDSLKEKEEFKKTAQRLLDFIDASPSCYHVIDNLKKELKGYTELNEGEEFVLEPGKGYYAVRNSSAIIAFRIPEGIKDKGIDGFKISAAHSDSPAFKIKPEPEMKVEDHYVRLNTEKYGGMLMAPWLDRPLSVAGRVFTGKDGNIEEKLINVDRDLLIIPNVAIHMNREVNNGYKYDAQVDMIPLFGAKTKDDEEMRSGAFDDIIASYAGVSKEEILGSDLFLYPRVKGTFLGADDEMIADRALDDLQCVYGIVHGFIGSSRGEIVNGEAGSDGVCIGEAGSDEAVSGEAGSYIPMCCVFDNEEVGSLTRQGADSDFLYDILYRITEAVGRIPDRDRGTRTEGDTGAMFMRLMSGSFMISADNAHAVHPNHTEYADPTNRPYLNMGVVLKSNAAQKYTTDGFTYAKITALAEAAEVPLQSYTNKSNIAGGSTLGNLSGRHVSIPTADIGLPQLAMHSCYETGGTYDTGYLIRLIRQFYK